MAATSTGEVFGVVTYNEEPGTIQRWVAKDDLQDWNMTFQQILVASGNELRLLVPSSTGTVHATNNKAIFKTDLPVNSAFRYSVERKQLESICRVVVKRKS